MKKRLIIWLSIGQPLFLFSKVKKQIIKNKTYKEKIKNFFQELEEIKLDKVGLK